MIEHYGREIDAGSVSAAVHQALLGNPMVPRPLYPMSGVQWTVELLDRTVGTPLHDAVRAVLAEATKDADPDERAVLSEVLSARPGLVASHDVYAAFARAAASDPAEAGILGRAVAQQIVSGDTAYSQMLRHHADTPALRAALASAFVLRDHAWFLSQLPTWLDGEFGEILGLLSATCAELSLGELRALRSELEALPLPEEAADLVPAYFDDVQDQPSFAERGLGVRWS